MKTLKPFTAKQVEEIEKLIERCAGFYPKSPAITYRKGLFSGYAVFLGDVCMSSGLNNFKEVYIALQCTYSAAAVLHHLG